MLLSVFEKLTSFDWRFSPSLQSGLLSTAASLRLCEADFFWLTLLSSFAKQTSFDSRFFQPFNRTFLSADAHFLRHFSRPTAWVSRAARPSLTQPPSPEGAIASAAPLAAAEGGVGFTRC
jgi:hypothetical protein